MELSIAHSFSRTPGARYPSEGPNSGEEFRERILAPMFREAIRNKQVLTVDLDGVVGYATSFLEEAFGGLVRTFGIKDVLAHLRVVGTDEPDLLDEVQDYISQAAKEARNS